MFERVGSRLARLLPFLPSADHLNRLSGLFATIGDAAVRQKTRMRKRAAASVYGI